MNFICLVLESFTFDSDLITYRFHFHWNVQSTIHFVSTSLVGVSHTTCTSRSFLFVSERQRARAKSMQNESLPICRLFQHRRQQFGNFAKRQNNENGILICCGILKAICYKKKIIGYRTYRCESISKLQQKDKKKQTFPLKKKQICCVNQIVPTANIVCCWFPISPRSVYNYVPKNTLQNVSSKTKSCLIFIRILPYYNLKFSVVV